VKLTREGVLDSCLKQDGPGAGAGSLATPSRNSSSRRNACDLQTCTRCAPSVRAQDAGVKREAARARLRRSRGGRVRATADPVTVPRWPCALRAQFPLVLVDEFQDTDARQWAIFESLFGEGRPAARRRSQAGDLPLPRRRLCDTYLAARATARIAAPLDRNFRSRPERAVGGQRVVRSRTPPIRRCSATASLHGHAAGRPCVRRRPADRRHAAPAIVVQSVPAATRT
jgi:exodeoxyribonuclease V beta subunit